MTLLLVEDNEDKLEEVRAFALAALDPFVDVAKSYREAKMLLASNSYDLVLLDMSIPVYGIEEGGSGNVLLYGGEDLLAWAKRRVEGLRVIILTQFDVFSSSDGVSKSSSDLARSLSESYPKVFLGLVHYRDTDNSWQSDLLGIIKGLEGSE